MDIAGQSEAPMCPEPIRPQDPACLEQSMSIVDPANIDLGQQKQGSSDGSDITLDPNLISLQRLIQNKTRHQTKHNFQA